MQQRLKKVLSALVFCALLFPLLAPTILGEAQSSPPASDAAWANPVNLSHSGSASNPILFNDSNNVLHAVWEDKVAGFMDTQQKGSGWTSPSQLSSPWIVKDPANPRKFSTNSPIPLLVANQDGMVYAFWIDAYSQLWYSRIAVNDFGIQNTWDAPRMLSDSTLNLAVTADSGGQLHLVYIYQNQTSKKQPGIYYLRLSGAVASAGTGAGGSNTGAKTASTAAKKQAASGWSDEVLLYGSSYFRSMSKDQANLTIAAGSTKGQIPVYVAWDNRPLKRVFFERSADGGQTWDQASEPAGMQTSTVSLEAFNITVGAAGSSAVLVWQTGQPGASCKQYTQGSTDSGGTWSAAQLMLSGVSGCAQENTFLVDQQNQIFLTSTVSDQVYLQVWNGKSWSEPQLQSELYGFINPDDYNTVNLQCHQFAFSGSNTLYSLGCDVTDVGDIWLLSRDIGSTTAWFQAKSNWSAPVDVAPNLPAISDLKVIAEGDQTAHAVWIASDPTRLQSSSINYANWNGEKWSVPIVVPQAANGNAAHLSAGLSKHGELLLAWSDNLTGSLYFSWADATKANSVEEWTAPRVLPSPKPAASLLDMLVSPSGAIYVAYAIPLDEDRGIYLLSSTDEGATWSSPVKVFDAAAAGLARVDRPSLYLSPDGRLGITWAQFTLLSGDPLALYQANSDDRGKTWSPAQKIAETGTVWNSVAAGSGQSLSIAWLEKTRDLFTLRFSRSANGGQSWDKPATVVNSASIPGSAALFQDAAGALHILVVIQDANRNIVLQHWLLDGATWTVKDRLALGQSVTDQATNFTAAMTPAGHLFSLFGMQSTGLSGDQSVNSLEFSNLALKLKPAAQAATPAAGAVPTVAPSPTPQPTATGLATAVPAAPVAAASLNKNRPAGGSPNGVTAGIVLSGLLVVVGFGVSRFSRRVHS